MELPDLQRALAASLAGRRPDPPGCEPGALAWTRDSLVSKRRRAAGHLLPRLRCALGQGWEASFREHAGSYNPAGMLHHVDDAWAFAERVQRGAADPAVRRAAQDDLVALKLRFVRDLREDAHRIRERRGPLLALLHTPQRAMVLKLPGSPGRLWYLRM